MGARLRPARTLRGQARPAANAAAQLAFNLMGTGLPSVLKGWASRAERLLQDAPEHPVHGYVAVVRGMMAFTAGDLGAAAELGRRALAEGDEILATEETATSAGTWLPVSAPRSVTLKGIADPVAVVSVQWR